jgi:hypothetical protein
MLTPRRLRTRQLTLAPRGRVNHGLPSYLDAAYRAGYGYDSLRWPLVVASITDCCDVPPPDTFRLGIHQSHRPGEIQGLG